MASGAKRSTWGFTRTADTEQTAGSASAGGLAARAGTPTARCRTHFWQSRRRTGWAWSPCWSPAEWKGQGAEAASPIAASCRQPRVTEAHSCACMTSRHMRSTDRERRRDSFIDRNIGLVGPANKQATREAPITRASSAGRGWHVIQRLQNPRRPTTIGTRSQSIVRLCQGTPHRAPLGCVHANEGRTASGKRRAPTGRCRAAAQAGRSRESGRCRTPTDGPSGSG